MLRGLLLGVVVLCATAIPAAAELVYFPSGRALSVKAVRQQGDRLVLFLRSGGTIEVDPIVISKVEPDEIEYPDEILEQLPFARSLREAPAVPSQYRELIESSSKRHGVDPKLVHALIQVESAYHSRAVSSAGARGLMQIMPATGRQYGALDLFDPKVNVDAGVRHLKMLLSRYSDVALALAAYNAGEGAVNRFGGIPPFRETQNYVTRILRILNQT
ncbi:MAG: lytic transglycosylase domain-containing protein [Vicinamibacterales bacterium]